MLWIKKICLDLENITMQAMCEHADDCINGFVLEAWLCMLLSQFYYMELVPLFLK